MCVGVCVCDYACKSVGVCVCAPIFTAKGADRDGERIKGLASP